MNKLIVVNKPPGYTSRDVVNKLSKILGEKRIGHTGTLDPLATGVLVCLTGKYTKLVELITSYDKEYIATVKLGIATDTLDVTGNIISSKVRDVTRSELLEVMNSFPCEYDQSVPMYSAVKINGKRLYEYARNNEKIELPKRRVKIYELELLEFNKDTFKFRCVVSKGCYIRSLIKDITDRLNIDGTMASLCRSKQGNFSLNDSYTIDDILSGNYKALDVQEFLDYPIIEINDKYLKVVLNGGKIPNVYNISKRVIFTHENKDLAIYKVQEEILRPEIMF